MPELPEVETVCNAINKNIRSKDIAKVNIINPNLRWKIDNKIIGYLENNRIIQDQDTWTKVGWTPYAGMELTGWPMYTIVDGNIVHKRQINGPLKGIPVTLPGSTGRLLKFN